MVTFVRFFVLRIQWFPIARPELPGTPQHSPRNSLVLTGNHFSACARGRAHAWRRAGEGRPCPCAAGRAGETPNPRYSPELPGTPRHSPELPDTPRYPPVLPGTRFSFLFLSLFFRGAPQDKAPMQSHTPDGRRHQAAQAGGRATDSARGPAWPRRPPAALRHRSSCRGSATRARVTSGPRSVKVHGDISSFVFLSIVIYLAAQQKSHGICSVHINSVHINLCAQTFGKRQRGRGEHGGGLCSKSVR